jgi:SAM-dependent methyltransferase
MQANPSHVYVAFEDAHWWYVGRRRIMSELVHQLLPPSRDLLVVDIGCGGGANLGALQDSYACVGFDTAPAALTAARERYPSITFKLGSSVPEMADELGRADLILMMDVIEHIEDDRGFAQAMVAASKPGCYFYLAVPADPRLWSNHDDAVGHQRRYVTETFRDLWRDLPVEEVMVDHYNRALYPVVRAARALNRLRDRSSGMDGTDFKMPPALINSLLAGILGRESTRLARRLHGARPDGFDFGVSMVAVLRRNGAFERP